MNDYIMTRIKDGHIEYEHDNKWHKLRLPKQTERDCIDQFCEQWAQVFVARLIEIQIRSL